MKVVVFHSFYGCDTGCCGHRVELENGDYIDKSGFTFSHPYHYDKLDPDKARAFAERIVREELGEEHVKDLDFERCIILDD